MAMTTRLWSINGLATELDMDRRTVAKRLRDVPPDGKLQGHPAWRLTTALRVLEEDRIARQSGIRFERDPDAVPPCIREAGGPFTCDRTPPNVVSEVVAVTLMCVARDVPELAVRMAVASGAPLPACFGLWQALGAAIIGYVDSFAERVGIRWREPDAHYYEPTIPDWEALADEVGEEVDMEAWKSYSAQRHQKFLGDDDACAV